MRTLLIVLDGVDDWPCKELGGKTPLEASHKPNLDRLAVNSILLRSRIAGKIAPESDEGILSILGLNPFKEHVGRGIFEWLSTGKKFKNGWLAMRTNFCTVKKGKIVDRRAGRRVTPTLAKALEHKINQIKFGVPFEFRATSGHRGVVVFKGSFSKHVQNTDPAYQRGKLGISNAQHNFKNKIVKCTSLKKDVKSRQSAEVVNEFSAGVLAVLAGEFPANGLLLRDAETTVPNADYSKWTIVAEMPVEVGIGLAFKMKVVKTKPRQPYSEVAKVVSREISHGNVYVHLKGPDIFGHEGKAVKKKRCIEQIDTGFFANLELPADVRIIITADHCTPCPLKAHSNDPVPTLVAGLGVIGEKNSFDERHAKRKREIPAWNLLKLASRSILRA